MRELAQMSGYTVIDPLSVIVTHLSEIIKKNAHELFGRKELILLLDNLKKANRELVEDLVPGVVSHLDLQKVLCSLLSEQVPIRDLQTILETLGELRVQREGHGPAHRVRAARRSSARSPAGSRARRQPER
jgi:flagellar biosynthesis protein FlhA